MYRFKSLLWFLINFKQTTRKSNNSAITCRDLKYMYLMLICLSQLLHTFLAHIHDYRTYVCYLAPCDTGQQILILITWKLPWEEKMKICVEEYYYMYYILCFGVLFFVRLCLLFKILVPLTGTEFPLITLSSQQYDRL